MNTITKLFWENDFPGLDPLTVDFDDFWTQKIPLVRLPWINVNVDKIIDRCSMLDDQFETVETQQQKSNWWDEPRSQGWQVLSIRAPAGNVIKDYLGHERQQQTQWIDRREYFDFFFDQMYSQGLPLEFVNIWKLAPNGWLAPHRDPRTHGKTMNYFYMALNQTAKLRIWPLGEVSIQPGEMVLFDQNDFVHSVINTTQTNRLIVSGRLDINGIGKLILDRLIQSVKEQYEF